MPSRDYCKGPRKTYAAAIRLAAAHTAPALLLTALPAAYVTIFAIVYYSQNPHAPLSGTIAAACVSLAAIWLVAALSIWRTAPNALSIAIYLTRAVGNWAAISFLILLSYGFSALPIQYTSILFIVLTPLLLGLHITADIQREVRRRLYSFLELAAAPTEPPAEIVIQK